MRLSGFVILSSIFLFVQESKNKIQEKISVGPKWAYRALYINIEAKDILKTKTLYSPQLK